MSNKSSGQLPENVHRLSTGVYVRTSIVGVLLIEQSQSSIKDPEVPVVDGEENPFDPKYKAAIEKANAQREQAALEAMIEFGLELCDENGNDASPPPGKWAKKLKRRGIEFDENDEMDLEFVYLKYIAVGAQDAELLKKLSGLNEEDIAQAERTFQRNEKRGANKPARPKPQRKSK